MALDVSGKEVTVNVGDLTSGEMSNFTDINSENPKIALLPWSEDKMKLFFDFLSQFILNVRGNQDKTRLFKNKC